MESYPNTQAIVLGGGLKLTQSGETLLSTASLARAKTAAAYYHENPARFNGNESTIVCSGASTWVRDDEYTRSEGSLMADELVASDVPARIIEVEEESNGTLANFVNSAPIINKDHISEESPLGVVTHKVHYPRARFYGNLVLGVPLNNIVAPGMNDTKRWLHENALRSIAHLFFTGVEIGDSEMIDQRSQQLRNFYKQFKLPHLMLVKKAY